MRKSAINGRRTKSASNIDRQIALELYHLIERSCGHSELADDIATVMDHWGDGQTSEQVLAYLQEINRNGQIFRKVFASNLEKRS